MTDNKITIKEKYNTEKDFTVGGLIATIQSADGKTSLENKFLGLNRTARISDIVVFEGEKIPEKPPSEFSLINDLQGLLHCDSTIKRNFFEWYLSKIEIFYKSDIYPDNSRTDFKIIIDLLLAELEYLFNSAPTNPVGTLHFSFEFERDAMRLRSELFTSFNYYSTKAVYIYL